MADEAEYEEGGREFRDGVEGDAEVEVGAEVAEVERHPVVHHANAEADSH